MPELGNKHACFSCDAKFYDLGRPEAICPKCGANQKDAKKTEAANPSAPVRRRRREEPVPAEPETGDAADAETGSDDLADEEIERPEGIEDDDVATDDDDDEDDDD